MNPATICSGFRKCGVYPFNPNAIDCSVSVVNPEVSLQQVNTVATSYHTGNGEIQQHIGTLSSISPETLSRYQRRLEGGYNLHDEEFIEWLKVNHPETFADIFNASPVAVGDPELTADESENNEVEGAPRATLSADVTENNRGEGEIRATVSADVTENNGGEGDLRATLTGDETENTEVESELRAMLTAADRTENIVVERDDKNATGDQPHNLRYISKYLVQFVPDAKPQKTETAVRISGARVLTSEKCVYILKEREEKRKQQEEEKESKKIEREQRKKVEEEQRKKDSGCRKEGPSSY
ncbi:uncharacterized protein [Dysidea avara]|uniref:uncharacterized protein n=1 Tax=Dysidea avara TaxID=196820 RepID=UPI0033199E1D